MARFSLICLLTVAALAMAAEAASVTVTGQWFRALPGKLPAAGYFTLHNNGRTAVALTGAQSPGCGMLMLHMTHNMGGMMQMMEMGQVEVPAGGSVSFAPGGYHLMCTEPTPALKPGASLPVTLRFSDGSQISANFAVRTATGH